LNQLVAITGASSGIGAATAKLFSENRHPLLLMARRVEQMEALGLANCLCKQVDVTNFDTVKSAIADARKAYGSVDCLINNAGVMYLGHPWEQDMDEWQAMVNVNIVGVMNGIRGVLGEMVARRSGTIFNVGSLAGRKTFQKHAAYCATKFAVHALSETIREEVAQHNVRVITIEPGAVETELITHTTSKKFQQEWWDGLGGSLNPKMWHARYCLPTNSRRKCACVRLSLHQQDQQIKYQRFSPAILCTIRSVRKAIKIENAKTSRM